MVSRRTAVFFALSSLFFGGTFVAAKAGLAYFPPLLFVALRFDIAAVVMLAYVGLTSSRSELLPRTRGDVRGHPRDRRARDRPDERAVVRRPTVRYQRRRLDRVQPQPDHDPGVRRVLALRRAPLSARWGRHGTRPARGRPRREPGPRELAGGAVGKGSSSSARSPPRWGRPHPPGRQRSLEHGPRRLGTTLRRGAKATCWPGRAASRRPRSRGLPKRSSRWATSASSPASSRTSPTSASSIRPARSART